MSTKEQKEALQEVIRKLVLKEAQEIVPILVKEVMSTMLMEIALTKQHNENSFSGNSDKRKRLVESQQRIDRSAEFDEYPTMSNRMMPQVSFEGDINLNADLGNINTNSFTKVDFRKTMEALDRKVNEQRGIIK